MKKVFQGIKSVFNMSLFVLTLVIYGLIKLCNKKYNKNYVDFLDQIINILTRHEQSNLEKKSSNE